MSATHRNAHRSRKTRRETRPGRRASMATGLAAALLACLFSPPGGLRAETPSSIRETRDVVVDAAKPRPAAPAPALPAPKGTSPAELLRRAQEFDSPPARELLAPDSRPWAGAPELILRNEHPRVLLAVGVLAATGGGGAAAASRADGSILVFAPGTGPEPRQAQMPEGHPAFALGLSGDGRALAAWAQGKGEIVFFDLGAGAGGQAQTQVVRLTAPLHGDAVLTLSADGQAIAAHDESGALWAGVRGGEMRPLGTLPGRPAAIGFSSGGGVLAAVDAQGDGAVWNPRTGKTLKRFQVPGGPFARGDFATAEDSDGQLALRARLWTEGGQLVRWDVLGNQPAPPATQGEDTARKEEGGWLELHGPRLFYVAQGQRWRATPSYEPLGLALSWSRQAGCLRLQDLDGAVRYFSAATGAPQSQCFAVDWSSVAIRADGTAAVPGLELRVHDVAGRGPDGSQINARALPDGTVFLWPASPKAAPGAAQATNSAIIAVPQTVAEDQAGPTTRPAASPSVALGVPLRTGLNAAGHARTLILGR